MGFEVKRQVIEAISRSKRTLIVTQEPWTTDSLSAAAALGLFLAKLNKQYETVAKGLTTENKPHFLPGLDKTKDTLGAVRAFEISLDVSHNPLEELHYDVKDGQLTVTLIPKAGEWSPRDVSFRHGEDRFDLIIALDCPDIHSLGALFRDHADFIYRLPIINIDCNPANEHWGQINLVDLNASSSTEILFDLFKEWNKNLIDEDVATALLSGMIYRTQSFRSSNVTPLTLGKASELLAIGARREEIVHGIWRTRTVPTLKLWGKALTHLEQDRDLGLVWSILTNQDAVETGTGLDDLNGVAKELISYAPEAKVIVLISESGKAMIHANGTLSAAELARPFGATGTREYAELDFPPGGDIVTTSHQIIDKLKQTMSALKNTRT